MCRRPGEVPE
jgi:hypothetical protein